MSRSWWGGEYLRGRGGEGEGDLHGVDSSELSSGGALCPFVVFHAGGC